jgi:phosphoserine phosphatase
MYIICDFDKTFLRNDFFAERFFKQALENPFFVINCFIRGGLLNLKKKMLRDFTPGYPIDFLINPYVLAELKKLKDGNNTLVLISASPQEFVERLITPLGIFDHIYGSSDVNLKGRNKLNYIQQKNMLPFFYFGDAKADNCIFNEAYAYCRVKPGKPLIIKYNA